MWIMIRKWLIRLGLINKSWKDVERYDDGWNERTSLMSTLIPENITSIMDMGAGTEHLRTHLSPTITYTPVDMERRTESTVVCDFNRKQFPDTSVDVIFISGCLEYIQDSSWFIHQVSAHCHTCILSYCILENYPDLTFRKNNAWRNHHTANEIISLFESNDMHIQKQLKTENNIFLFTK